jgi:hypothetical protein
VSWIPVGSRANRKEPNYFLFADYTGTIRVQHVLGYDLLFLTQRDRGVNPGGTASRDATRHKGNHSP